MKIKVSVLLALAVACFSKAASAEDGWVPIAESKDGGTWDVKSGSLEFSQTKAEVPIAVVIGRISNKRSPSIALYKWYVPIKDCVKENGIVVSLNMSGEYIFENDFVFGSGNIASAMAEAICGAASHQIKNATDKSM